MQDFYWSDRRSGSAGYHHCYSVKISSKDNKAEPESAFTYMHTVLWGESESCWQRYDYLTQFAEIEFSLSFSLFLFLFFPLIFPAVFPKSRLHVRSYRIHKSFAPCAAFLKGLEAAPGNLRVLGEGHFQRNGDFHPPAFPLHPCKPHPAFPGKPGGDFGRGCRSQDKFPAEFGDVPGRAAPSPHSGDSPRGCWDLMSGMRWTKGGNSWGIATSGTSRPRCCSCHPF